MVPHLESVGSFWPADQVGAVLIGFVDACCLPISITARPSGGVRCELQGAIVTITPHPAGCRLSVSTETPGGAAEVTRLATLARLYAWQMVTRNELVTAGGVARRLAWYDYETVTAIKAYSAMLREHGSALREGGASPAASLAIALRPCDPPPIVGCLPPDWAHLVGGDAPCWQPDATPDPVWYTRRWGTTDSPTPEASQPADAPAMSYEAGVVADFNATYKAMKASGAVSSVEGWLRSRNVGITERQFLAWRKRHG